MEFLIDLALFAAKVGLVTFAIVVVLSMIFSGVRRGRGEELGQIWIYPLDDYFQDLSNSIREKILDKKAFKALIKQQKPSKEERGRCFVLEFDGDIMASGADQLAAEITSLVPILGKKDEVVLLLESPGGKASSYGYAASQLARLRETEAEVTICVDQVAASGGYMMAVVGHQILAGPFALLGSIGVVATVPNLHNLLKKFDIDVKEYTAGKYKRTVSLLGENTPEGQQKFQEELELFHDSFKEHIQHYRPQCDIETISTGEVWYGAKALGLGLIDRIITSQAYLLERSKEMRLFKVSFRSPNRLRERLGVAIKSLLNPASRV